MVQKTKLLPLFLALTLSSVVLVMLAWVLDVGAAVGDSCDVPSDTHATIQSAVDDTTCDTVNLTSSLFIENVNVPRSVKIQGQGANSTSVEGNGGSVFTIQAGHVVTLNNLTIAKGITSNGGGILNEGSNLTIYNCAITNNVAHYGGGGIYNASEGIITINNCSMSFNDDGNRGGAIYNQGGVITINDSTFITNTARSRGGAIYNANGIVTIQNSVLSGNSTMVEDTDGGGIYHESGTMTIMGSLIYSNTAERFGGGVHFVDGMLEIIATNLIKNHTEYVGGAIYIEQGEIEVESSGFFSNSARIGAGIANSVGGTIYIADSTLSENAAPNGGGIANIGILNIVNSTFSGNSAEWGGGIENRESANSPDVGILTVTNTTINGNTANSGGGIYNWNNASVSLANTIISNSSGNDCAGDGVFVSMGHNLDSDSSCNLTSMGDISNIDPLLGPLQDNGGATWTHELLTDSPAIDAGSCPSTTTDQRGLSRPIDNLEVVNADDGCDIGAFEVQIELNFTVYLPIMAND